MSDARVQFAVLGVPRTKDNSRHISRLGHIYTRTRDLVEYERTVVASYLARGRREDGASRTARYEVELVYYFPDRRRRDVANYAKSICDALSGIIWHDDSQIDVITQRRGEIDRAHPRVDITVSVLAGF